MKKFLLFLLPLLVVSCSLFKSKDEKLTADKWILHSKFISTYKDGKSDSKLVYFKKSEEKLVFNFKTDGTVHITEDNGNKFATITWNWKSDAKKYIQLNRGNYYGDFLVLELTGKTFEISKSDISTMDSELMTFKHYDDTEWYDDEKVDMMNKISN